MRAAWYETQGPARDVLKVGILAEQTPGPGEVRIRIAASGINPGDIKKRQDAFGYGMPYPRVIPHSDGAGEIDLVGEGVGADWIGHRVWCYGAQSYRPFGTAAAYTVVPASQAVSLPDGISFERRCERQRIAAHAQSGFPWTRLLSPTNDSKRRARADGSSCCFHDSVSALTSRPAAIPLCDQLVYSAVRRRGVHRSSAVVNPGQERGRVVCVS